MVGNGSRRSGDGDLSGPSSALLCIFTARFTGISVLPTPLLLTFSPSRHSKKHPHPPATVASHFRPNSRLLHRGDN